MHPPQPHHSAGVFKHVQAVGERFGVMATASSPVQSVGSCSYCAIKQWLLSNSQHDMQEFQCLVHLEWGEVDYELIAVVLCSRLEEVAVEVYGLLVKAFIAYQA